MVWASHDLADLTGDGTPELILDYGRTSCCTSFHTFHIYNLTTTPPNRLKFNVASYERESLIGGSESIFTPLSIGKSNNGFILESTLGDPVFNPCDFKEHATFYWNGNFFEQTEVRYAIKSSDYYNNSVCDFYRNFNASQEETNIIIDTMKDVALSGPTYPRGQYHPAVQFRLGEYHARLGNVDQANQFFQKVLSYDSENADTPSPWTENAEIFLEHYHQPSDFYSTCQLSKLCDLKLALKHLGETHSLVDVNAFVNALIEYGVPIKAFGQFDFDRDGNFELWVTIQERGKQDYALWVMVNDLQDQHALYIDRIDVKSPSLSYLYQDGFAFSPFVQVYPDIFVQLHWLKISQTPYLTILKKSEYTPDEDEIIRQYLDQTVDDLLNGRNPEDVIGALEDIQSSMVCPGTFGCDKLHYNLGLAYELIGEEALAVENYLTLWNDYPESIYTIMARAKLVLEPDE